jgi:hypothetical protein
MRSICSFGLAVGPMKRSDRRYATLIDGDGQVSNKTENKKRGFSSRVQYHNMLRIENRKNKKYKVKAASSHKLSYSNTVAHVNIPKYKRHYITETALESVCGHFGELIPDWFKSSDPKACSGYYKKSKFAWRPIEFADKLPGLQRYYSIVNRIDYCQSLLDLADEKTPREVTMALLEIQDSFQMLTLHMEMKNCYTDLDLEKDPDQISMLPPADFFEPSQGPPFSISELPDVLNYLPYISFWRDSDGTPTDNMLIKRLLFLLYKCLPYPYKRRSFENAIVESWSDMIQRIFGKNSDKNEQEKERMEFERKYTADIFQVTIRLTMASLLGIYEHCNVRANFRSRRRIYKWFCMNRPGQEEISTWILRYKELVLCSFREYLFYMIERVGGVSDFLGKTSYWNILKYNTFEMMDNARSQINLAIDRYHEDYSISERGLENLWNSVESVFLPRGSQRMFGSNMDRDSESFVWFPGQSWFHRVQYDLDTMNRKILKNANRPKTAIFECMGLEKMEEVEAFKKKYNQFNKDAVDPDFLLQSIRDCICERIKESDPFKPMSYFWLGDFPIRFNANCLNSLRDSEDMYESEEGASTLKDVLSFLYSYRPYEYQVLKCYFSAVRKKRGLLIYHFTEDAFDSQIQTLRRAYETEDTLDSSAGLYYICPNCNSIKITVRDFSQHNNPDNIGGWTSEGVCINLDDEKFYCTKISSKDNPKKRNPTSNIIKEMFAKDDADKSEVRTASNIKRFMSLDDVKHLRSVVSKEERTSLEKYIEKRQLQEDCLDTELIPFYLPGHLLHTAKGNVLGCPQCMKPVYYSRDMFRNGIKNISCGCKDKASECEFKCALCNVDCHNYCFVKLVWDDRDIKDQALRYVCLCETHRNRWTSDIPTVPRLSKLERDKKEVKVNFSEDGRFMSYSETKAAAPKRKAPPKNQKAASKKNATVRNGLEKKMKVLKQKSKISKNNDFRAVNNSISLV